MAREKKEPVFRIGAILAEKNMSNNEFAEKMGVSIGTVSEWVNHKVYPDPSKFRLIAEVTNVNMQEILIKTEPIKD
ncbi:helix-turn-helix domain-containing protein [Sphingobacterium sp. HSC-15S19]|uniref:helix-turn-helix domain-containing protein n=1 Tax=Sphingobacterium sp. HSC-15S19 TaxID=2910971 RepID=UPI003D19F0D6